MIEEGSTIAALATAPVPSGLAVVRISGPRTRTALKALFRAKQSVVDDPRRLVFGDLLDHQSGDVIDRALAVFMPGPASYTGEDVGEFQFHGSPLLVQKILRSLFAFGITPAEPGEFTKRAFINGKIDLIQAEAICDLIGATSEEALRVATEHLRGRFSEAVTLLGEPLRDALAELEASIDFPDEDIQPKQRAEISVTLQASSNELNRLLQTYRYGIVVKEGVRVLLAGPPNAGKSSMLNLLLGTKRAIVSDVAGTTRDLIEEVGLIDGKRFVFCDSAGITDSSDKVEKIGVELARERIPWADVVLFVVDACDPPAKWEPILQELRRSAKKIWMVVNKTDLNPNAFSAVYCDSEVCLQNFYLSAKTGAGVEALKQALADEVNLRAADGADASTIVVNERQRACLEKALDAINRTRNTLEQNLPTELASSELRIALNALEEIVGRTYTEDILGRIFERFCIGK